jgi:hypothetical protein
VTGHKPITDAICSMWTAGWDPDRDNLELFTRDFGAILCGSLLEARGAVLVARDGEHGFHSSVSFPDKHIEAFPWHKVYKRLRCRDGESLVYFFDSVRGAPHETEC